MDTQLPPDLPPEAKLQIENIIAKAKGVEIDAPSPEEQERFLSGFSLAALVYSFVYFRAMKDRVFTWLGLFSSLVFLPGLVIMPFMARRRAWQSREWISFNEFKASQKAWDKAGFYGLLFLLISGYLFLRISYPIFESLLKQNSTSDNPAQQLQDLQNNLQSLQQGD